MPNAPCPVVSRSTVSRLPCGRVFGYSCDAASAAAYGRLPEWPKGTVCKTVGSAYVGSNPTPATTCENGPLAAETRPAGRFLLVTSCISACHCGSMYGSVHVHMVYGVRAKLAVRITARLAGPRPFCPVTGPPTAAHSGRPVFRCPLAPGGGLALLVPEAGAGWPDRARAISWRLHGGDDRVCVAGHRDGRPAGRRGKRRCARTWMPRRAAASAPAVNTRVALRTTRRPGSRAAGNGPQAFPARVATRDGGRRLQCRRPR